MEDKRGVPWMGLAIVAAVLAIALVQGLTIQEVGIPGVASIKFAQRADPNRSDGSSSTNWSSPSTSTGGTTGRSTGSHTVEGSWTGARGDVSVEVTQVEDQGGHLRVRATVINGTNDALTLPLFGNASAVDESHRSYQASPSDSDWPDNVASGQSVSGTIEFVETYTAGGGTLDLTFAHLFGFDAPSGSLTVAGITRP